ncbi:MAG: esterase/lipase family protein [Betaproteobacteria bacterium]
MGKKLLIVHGYSDGSKSFLGLADFFHKRAGYAREDIYFIDYTSMDDETTYFDLADKLDTDYRRVSKGERIDVACHSTGSLVVRAWLALHNERARLRTPQQLPPCPIKRLLCFAPANFGSDLAVLGQSFLSKFRTTLFNEHSDDKDAFETGKVLLQGLEPASPFQWMLSMHDLHGAHSYFGADERPDRRCYPFVFAAADSYGGLQADLIKQRGMAGTDGTVRIPGTSLNTRMCTLDFPDDRDPELYWHAEAKFPNIPFGVFVGFNHGSIVDPDTDGFSGDFGPGPLAVHALSVEKDDQYAALAREFDKATERNYQRAKGNSARRFQQFFFKVRDDVDQPVHDFYIDFHVLAADGSVDKALTLQFDQLLKTSFCRHSVDASHRCLLLDCSELGAFKQSLDKAEAKLMLQVDGTSGLPDVTYRRQTFEVYPRRKDGDPAFLCPNTTTLVDIVLNRQQSARMLVLKDSALRPIPLEPLPSDAKMVGGGRAELVSPYPK